MEELSLQRDNQDDVSPHPAWLFLYKVKCVIVNQWLCGVKPVWTWNLQTLLSLVQFVNIFNK